MVLELETYTCPSVYLSHINHFFERDPTFVCLGQWASKDDSHHLKRVFYIFLIYMLIVKM